VTTTDKDRIQWATNLQKGEKGGMKTFMGDPRELRFDSWGSPSGLVVSFSTSDRCGSASRTLQAVLLPDLRKVPYLTTLGTGPHVPPVYNPVVDTLGFGLSHSSSPFSASPTSSLYA
jgi:hypothetical protein